MSDTGESRHHSYVVRTDGVGGTLRDDAAKRETFFSRDLGTVISFAQTIQADQWVTKRVRINALLAESRETNLASFTVYPEVASRGRQILISPKKPADAHIPGGPIVGFRCWRLKATSRLTGRTKMAGDQLAPEVVVDEVELLAMYKPAVWTGAQVRFVCEHLHETPQASCKCGLHAYHSLNEAMGEQILGQGPVAQYPAVLGVVSGHGDILIHGRGWRAEEAHILAFADFDKRSDEARGYLSRFWDVPVIPFSDLAEFATSKGRFIRKEQAEDTDLG